MFMTTSTPDAGIRRRLAGGIVPGSHWEPEQEETTFEEFLQAWRENVAQIRHLAETHLYNSQGSLTFEDLWMHRLLVSKNIFEMQFGIIQYFGEKFLEEPIDAPLPPLLEEVEKEISALVDILHQWHGSPEAQADLPEEFLKSMDEALNGETEDFDHGLDARLAAAK